MSAADCEQQETGWGILEDLPGDPMIWVLIFSELAAFGLFLGAFTVARAIHPAVFAAGQAVLDSNLAGLNTIVLVTSGWAAARATKAARTSEKQASRRWLLTAMALGGFFIAIKLTEYAEEIGRGIGLETSPFFTLYFLLTGFHLLHVCLGIVILAVVCRRADISGVETGAAFWHMVDLVWIVMFPILYLVR
ncbi:Heme/copper-type cytochrome/quinol oxidase, subunit 3 [Bradyrhizobium japonicum]|uniref:Heme/copper-type cytochrome/quinol oxidase, subunit 3 n=1 Tax=Bradyrhizobium japonicum TaxID=375 RepID=A0A0A3XZC2_BRAJP|nr:cytochrome c oxidase subunit 3 family protein [Bradyrhizobium japonicum]KGT78664.1 Heme/copper-type cytochrome/quinol oxidase, subunit 3 [Bradyrhizobium japonicum]MCS3897731.1 nitric oxide reductase NorE protein [Bradyrhizobium japonicum USDA 38]MCS3940785.1 nitric oxide reductase NorE protein [Bradyrhizobium japonicum]MCW2217159.1 nitric oxide reductase NorE protein [Bradyrhizobium japonicum]MCW2341774.1 nitric oxide reductase NorE protein [Bradyrhizobium japonicum]